MGKKRKTPKQKIFCGSLEELSLNNLKDLTEMPIDVLRKLCDSGEAKASLFNHDELISMSNSSVMKNVGRKGIQKLHSLGKIERISFEELKLLHYSKAADLLSIPKLQKICNSRKMLKPGHRDLKDLVLVMCQTDLTVEEIRKLCVSGALNHFTNEGIAILSVDGYIKSISTENLRKFCIGHTGITYKNMKKIFDNQEIITNLSVEELHELCLRTEFLDGVAGEELLNIVMSEKAENGNPQSKIADFWVKYSSVERSKVEN